MTKEELMRTKNFVTICVFIVTLVYIVIIYLIFFNNAVYNFFIKDQPLLFQYDAKNNFTIITALYVLLVGPISSIYFRKRRKFNTENGIEIELTRNKINSDKVIKCSNRFKYIFFNCSYTGKPTTKMPLFIKIQKPSAIRSRDLIQMSEAKWRKYNSINHYYCPSCGKEQFDNNLVENYQPIQQAKFYKYIAIFTVIALLFNILSITAFISGGQVKISSVFFTLAIFVVSFFALLLIKK